MLILKENSTNPVKIFAETIEQEAIDQIKQLTNCPIYSDNVIRIMPDTHAGKGCTIGTTMTITDKITPNLVGVDIGCGMLCINLGNIDIDLEKLDDTIHKYVPFGFNIHSKSQSQFLDLNNLYCINNCDLERAELSLGTLGGGNHFIEISEDKNSNKFLIIHSGSRHLGTQVCKYYQDHATVEMFDIKEIISKLKEENRQSEIESTLKSLPKIPKELSYVSGEYFSKYLHDMKITQDFAKLNRETIAYIISDKMKWHNINYAFETIHNYIDTENMILRKGAVSAKKDEILLIPINMRDGSLLCVGKGNPDWNYSAPHGAGRLMSRAKAKEILSLDEFRNTMSSIYTTSVSKNTIDEAPMAYKPIEEIIKCIKPTVEIIDILKPIYNFKAN